MIYKGWRFCFRIGSLIFSWQAIEGSVWYNIWHHVPSLLQRYLMEQPVSSSPTRARRELPRPYWNSGTALTVNFQDALLGIPQKGSTKINKSRKLNHVKSQSRLKTSPDGKIVCSLMFTLSWIPRSAHGFLTVRRHQPHLARWYPPSRKLMIGSSSANWATRLENA